MTNFRSYSECTSTDVFRSCARGIVLPVGALEQHGPHLPLSTDSDIAFGLGRELAVRCDLLVAPTIEYGARSLPQSGGGPSFPGTVPIPGTTLIESFASVISGYAETRATQLLIVNGHYENEPFLFEALELCRERGALRNTKVVAVSWWNLVNERFIADWYSGQFPGWHAEHAGLAETSLMLHLRPNLVRGERPNHDSPPAPGVYVHPIDPNLISNRGVLARTAGASAEFGKALFSHVADELESVTRAPHGLLHGLSASASDGRI